jgi:uncharacterized protein (TIGR02266 family)
LAYDSAVSDPISTSKSARENLSRGLNALQGDASVPPQLVELAAPIAQAMGALHQIEKTNQIAPHADTALNHLRGALNQLQTHPQAGHPAVAKALEAVASSLSLVHQLTRMGNAPAPAPAPQAPPAHVPHQGAPQQLQPQHVQPQAAANKGSTQAMAQKQAMPGGAPQQQPAPVIQQRSPDPFAARDPFAAAPSPAGPPATPSMPVPAPPAQGNMQLIAADLGAHSPTNFFKGLAGNDIIDHGGLFISTYVSPKIGTAVRLKVSLPGGYEFEANAVVKWVREQGGDAPPGFGAQFTGITNEARQLVYRYVRNREPLFYDDL